MNMWAEGRAYGYIRFKKSVPTENRGVVVLLLPVPAPALWADVAITINNRNISKQNEVIFRWSSALAMADLSVRLWGVCFAGMNRGIIRNKGQRATLPLSPGILRFPI